MYTWERQTGSPREILDFFKFMEFVMAKNQFSYKIILHPDPDFAQFFRASLRAGTGIHDDEVLGTSGSKEEEEDYGGEEN